MRYRSSAVAKSGRQSASSQSKCFVIQCKLVGLWFGLGKAHALTSVIEIWPVQLVVVDISVESKVKVLINVQLAAFLKQVVGLIAEFLNRSAVVDAVVRTGYWLTALGVRLF